MYFISSLSSFGTRDCFGCRLDRGSDNGPKVIGKKEKEETVAVVGIRNDGRWVYKGIL